MQRTKVAAIVSVGVFMASLDLFIVNIAFPAIEHDFGGTSLASLSWILNAYAIVFAALLVPAGRTADRLGRKRSFIAGLVLFTAASALSAAAPNVELLVAARVLQAVGAAALFPTSLALLLPEFPPAQRRTAVSIWAAVGGVAAAAGPPIGGLLVQAGWQLVFLVNVPIGIVLLLTGVWHESVIRAGLQIAPGPAMAATFAVPAGMLAARVGERVTGALGALLFAAGGAFWTSRIGPTPDYVGAFLPGMLIGGAG